MRLDFTPLSMTELPTRPGEILDRIADDGESFLIERNGRQRACLFPISVFLPDISPARIARELDELQKSGEMTHTTITGEKEVTIRVAHAAGGNPYSIIITLPHNYPNACPRVYVSEVDDRAPHRFADGALCIFGVTVFGIQASTRRGMPWPAPDNGSADMRRGGTRALGRTGGSAMNAKSRLFERIEQLYDVGLVGQAKVTIAGCGSGGSQVALQLLMSGIRNFVLYDKETLGEENVIRHACGLRYIGWQKTEAVLDLLKDGNPDVNVDPRNEDLMEVADLDERVRAADVVILATDNEPSRYRLNEACVRTETPFVVGSVFTRGIGGEVFAYRPKESGCLGCLEMYLERKPLREGVREIDLVNQAERDAMYGLPIAEIKDSPGLNVDIAFITNFHTRFALDAIARRLPERPKNMEPIKPNYVAWGNRPVHPFERHFQLQTMTLPAIAGCKICEEQFV